MKTLSERGSEAALPVARMVVHTPFSIAVAVATACDSNWPLDRFNGAALDS
jgi:hypothetical protein